MINKTIKKIKETSDAIAAILKDFASIVASIAAIGTASITGYIEIKKLTVVALQTRKETNKQIKEIRSSSPLGHATSTTETAAIVGIPSPIETYKMDYNTGILAFSLLVIPVIWFFKKKKS
jgi:hypothetical protein